MSHSEIDNIIFGVLSTEEIVRNAACIVSNTNLTGQESVYDERMGVIENGKVCQSCGLTNAMCPGHYGYIKLAHPIYHPMFYRHCVNFLNLFCTHCSRLHVSADHLDLLNITGSMSDVLEYITKSVKTCYYCKNARFTYTFVPSDCVVMRSVKANNKPVKTEVSPTEALAILSAIIDCDVALLGLDPLRVRPKSLIMECMPVLPIRARPYIISDGNVCDDDLTVVYQSIVKLNKKFTIEKLPALIFQITTFMNNSDGKSKHNNGGRAIKGIKERISGKDGIIRNNMSGKRVNQSARTVIGPDPTLRTNEVAIPVHIATKLTVPESVNDLNIAQLQSVVDAGRANFVIRDGSKINLKYACRTQGTYVVSGDTVTREGRVVTGDYKEGDVITRGGKTIMYTMPEKRKFDLVIGDTVERHLTDGDTVLINRQPTLHKCSMLAKKIVVRPGKTMRLNLATTKVFNADFDGDEMNIHVPQDYVARAELDVIASTAANVISSQSSKPHIAVVQDGMLGTYLMTKNDYVIPEGPFMDMCMSIEADFARLAYIREKMPLCGRALVSLILPKDFTYTKSVCIVDGIFLSGAITKKVLSSMVQTLYHDYGTVLSFVDQIQFISNMWLTRFGFSIGLGDCLPRDGLEETIQKNVSRCFAEAHKINETVFNPKIKHAKVSMSLARAKDMGMKAAKDAFDDTNGFVSTVTSGSKGDYFNVCQITGLLGQQNVGGGRIAPELNNGTRTLPHYPRYPLEENYEASGFVRSAFIRGLKPQEFFFHAMSGREGVSDTALKTAVSGYTQRKMIKIMEDIKVDYDGTVRNSSGDIIQWEYASDGLDRTRTIPRGGHTDFCDIDRLANALNDDFERALKL